MIHTTYEATYFDTHAYLYLNNVIPFQLFKYIYYIMSTIRKRINLRSPRKQQHYYKFYKNKSIYIQKQYCTK